MILSILTYSPAWPEDPNNHEPCEHDRLRTCVAGGLTTVAGTVAHDVGHGSFIAHDLLVSLGDRDTADAGLPDSMSDVATPESIRWSHFPVIERHQDRHLPLPSGVDDFQHVPMLSKQGLRFDENMGPFQIGIFTP